MFVGPCWLLCLACCWPVVAVMAVCLPLLLAWSPVPQGVWRLRINLCWRRTFGFRWRSQPRLRPQHFAEWIRAMTDKVHEQPPVTVVANPMQHAMAAAQARALGKAGPGDQPVEDGPAQIKGGGQGSGTPMAARDKNAHLADVAKAPPQHQADEQAPEDDQPHDDEDQDPWQAGGQWSSEERPSGWGAGKGYWQKGYGKKKGRKSKKKTQWPQQGQNKKGRWAEQPRMKSRVGRRCRARMVQMSPWRIRGWCRKLRCQQLPLAQLPSLPECSRPLASSSSRPVVIRNSQHRWSPHRRRRWQKCKQARERQPWKW